MVHIVNPGPEDYHMHTLNFSDGTETIDGMVRAAGEFDLQKIVITDHSQASIDVLGLGKKTFREMISRWKNIHNDVKVQWGVEADLLNSQGDICADIQGLTPDFIILSAHPESYVDVPDTVTDGYIRAIERYGNLFALLGHPDADYFPQLDVARLAAVANMYHIPGEVDGANLCYGRTDRDKMKTMVEEFDQVYVNSDAHTLYELKYAREIAFKALQELGVEVEIDARAACVATPFPQEFDHHL